MTTQRGRASVIGTLSLVEYVELFTPTTPVRRSHSLATIPTFRIEMFHSPDPTEIPCDSGNADATAKTKPKGDGDQVERGGDESSAYGDVAEEKPEQRADGAMDALLGKFEDPLDEEVPTKIELPPVIKRSASTPSIASTLIEPSVPPQSQETSGKKVLSRRHSDKGYCSSCDGDGYGSTSANNPQRRRRKLTPAISQPPSAEELKEGLRVLSARSIDEVDETLLSDSSEGDSAPEEETLEGGKSEPADDNTSSSSSEDEINIRRTSDDTEKKMPPKRKSTPASLPRSPYFAAPSKGKAIGSDPLIYYEDDEMANNSVNDDNMSLDSGVSCHEFDLECVTFSDPEDERFNIYKKDGKRAKDKLRHSESAPENMTYGISKSEDQKGVSTRQRKLTPAKLQHPPTFRAPSRKAHKFTESLEESIEEAESEQVWKENKLNQQTTLSLPERTSPKIKKKNGDSKTKEIVPTNTSGARKKIPAAGDKMKVLEPADRKGGENETKSSKKGPGKLKRKNTPAYLIRQNRFDVPSQSAKSKVNQAVAEDDEDADEAVSSPASTTQKKSSSPAAQKRPISGSSSNTDGQNKDDNNRTEQSKTQPKPMKKVLRRKNTPATLNIAFKLDVKKTLQDAAIDSFQEEDAENAGETNSDENSEESPVEGAVGCITITKDETDSDEDSDSDDEPSGRVSNLGDLPDEKIYEHSNSQQAARTRRRKITPIPPIMAPQNKPAVQHRESTEHVPIGEET
ncbi:nucleolar protein dao-5-like isoform X2 [Ptychodera flava]|uniref:nucleolar protein dao-5-like isoform X2 n=1 Tax=Ptychodera flava TaxID=63121 RepID=UPI00396A66E4